MAVKGAGSQGSVSNAIKAALVNHGYEHLGDVGEGCFGTVILANRSASGTSAMKEQSTRAGHSSVAIKVIDTQRDWHACKDALKESRILARLVHPFIVRYIESFTEDGRLFIAMDYCECGTLHAHIRKSKDAGKGLPQEQVLRWFTQTVFALLYIHDEHILHRDLKSKNLFLSTGGHLRVGDFGLSKVLDYTKECAHTHVGTPYYMAPEVCFDMPYSSSADMWSLGCVLYEMCSKRVPFDGPDIKALIQTITQGPTPQISKMYPATIREFCRDLLNRDADARPRADEILRKPGLQAMVRRIAEETKLIENYTLPIIEGHHCNSSVSAGTGAAAPRRLKSIPTLQSSPGSALLAKTPDTQAVATQRGSQAHAGKYTMNDSVEFYSESHKAWVPANPIRVYASGQIILDAKPGKCLSVEEQNDRVRPRLLQDQPVGAIAAARTPGEKPGCAAALQTPAPSLPPSIINGLACGAPRSSFVPVDRVPSEAAKLPHIREPPRPSSERQLLAAAPGTNGRDDAAARGTMMQRIASRGVLRGRTVSPVLRVLRGRTAS